MRNLLLPQREFIERRRAVRLAVVSGRKPDMTVEGSGEAGWIFKATQLRQQDLHATIALAGELFDDQTREKLWLHGPPETRWPSMVRQHIPSRPLVQLSIDQAVKKYYAPKH